jgi:uncharacterized protein (AIM24 family)
MKLSKELTPWPVLRAEFEEEERLYTRLDAVMAYTPGVRFKVRGAGWFVRALKGQGALLLELAGGPGDAAYLAPSLKRLAKYGSSMGDIAVIQVDGRVLVKHDMYLAHHGDLRWSVKWAGLVSGRLKFGEVLMTVLEGHGEVAVAAPGTIAEVEAEPGMYVDNRHIVAMEPCSTSLTFSSFYVSFLGGKLLYVKFNEPCRVWISTRKL